MNFLRPLRRHGLRVLVPLAAAAALLAACGGGTSQVQSFKPTRLVVLGDETGLVVDVDNNQDGYRYSINDGVTAVTATTARCLLLPSPPQIIAAHYGFRFQACNPPDDKGVRPTPLAFGLGRVEATADDPVNGLQAQIDAAAGTTGSPIGTGDLVMLMIGTHDVIDTYTRRAANTLATDAAAIDEATRRGGVMATQVNRVLATGARGLVITVPVLGKSPFALGKSAADQTLITELTAAFNTALRLGIDATKYDGRNYGLVLADDVTAAIVRFPASYLGGARNITEALCARSVLPKGCVTAAAVAATATTPAKDAVESNTHLWASDIHLGYVANTQIGNQALSRAVNNPF